MNKHEEIIDYMPLFNGGELLLSKRLPDVTIIDNITKKEEHKPFRWANYVNISINLKNQEDKTMILRAHANVGDFCFGSYYYEPIKLTNSKLTLKFEKSDIEKSVS